MVLGLVSATYGALGTDSVADVTEAVNGFFDEKHLRIKLDVNEGSMGGVDPAPGQRKTLKVVYTREEGGEQQEVTAEEGETLELLAAGQPDYYWPADGPIQILEARYGDANDKTRTIDVTSEAREKLLAENGFKLSMPVSFGQDPAPGTVKSLSVMYVDAPGAEPKTVSAGEGETLNIDSSAPAAAPEEAPQADKEEAPQADKEEAPQADKVEEPQAAPEAAPSSGNVPSQKLEWKSVDGRLVVNGRAFDLKGWNWAGLETECRRPEGLGQTTARQLLDFFASQGFNAVRLAVSTSFALDLDGPSKDMPDSELQGLSNGQLLEKLVDLAGERGILVVLDMHKLHESRDNPDLWYDDSFSTEDVLRGWDALLDRTKSKWNLMGVDLKNEPHGAASWGDSNPSYDWNRAAEQMINHLIERHPEWKGLFFVQGVSEGNNIDTDNRSGYAAFNGGSLEGVAKHPIGPGIVDPNQNAARVVYAPHVFGPSIYNQDYFGRGDFPGCMWDVWAKHFGFAKDATGRAVVLGEWGGWYNSDADCTWHSCIVDYLTQNGLNSAFYSGGLLNDDWQTPVQAKLDLLARLQPNPSKLKPAGQQLFLTGPEGEVEL